MSANALPELLVTADQRRFRLQAETTYQVGRNPAADIPLADGQVSWRHGEFRWDGTAWTYTDAGSSNGTFLDGDAVGTFSITDSCALRLGGRSAVSVLVCDPVTAGAPGPAPARPVPAGRELPTWAGVSPSQGPVSITRLPVSPVEVLRIGRDPRSDRVLDDLQVSRNHAELHRKGNGYLIKDVGSRNGVFVNGARVSSEPVSEKDRIRIGRSTFRIVGGDLQQFYDEGTVFARNLFVRVKVNKYDEREGKKPGRLEKAWQSLAGLLPGGKKPKVLLDGVSFAVPGNCLLGVIGPSGAGKTTLLHALAGTRPATAGQVLYDSTDLYENYDELRHSIGLVPQENILHTGLPVRDALRYSAKLRFNADTKPEERDKRVDEVISDLKLSKRAATVVSRLSGGQLKRVNVAQELLTKPKVLYLDEPTSGLDPGMDRALMRQLSELAHDSDGHTVIVITHSVLNLHECDQLLVLAKGGKVAFCGTPQETRSYFGDRDWTDVLDDLEADEEGRWAAKFRQYSGEPDVPPASPASPALSALSASDSSRVKIEHTRLPNWVRQVRTLTARYWQLTRSDLGYLAFTGVLALVLGWLIHVFPAKQGLTGLPHSNLFAAELLQTLIICSCLLGTASSFREIVKEEAIYKRERSAGLSSRAYLMSKILLLSAVNIVQSVAIVLLGLVGRPLPPHGVVLTPYPLLELLVAITALTLASMCLGLLVSSVAGTSERATQFLVLLPITQIILSGAVLPLAGLPVLNVLSYLTPARWGFAAVAATVNLNLLNPLGATTDSLWTPSVFDWLRDIGAMVVISLVCLVVTWVSLLRHDPGRHKVLVLLGKVLARD